MDGTPQIIQFPLVSSIDEGTDPKSLPAGSLRSITNMEWTKDGRLDKRAGTVGLSKNLSGGGTIAAAKRLFLRGDELLMTDGANLYSYSPTAGTWLNTGWIPEVGLTWRPLADTVDGMISSDTAVRSDGIVIHAWIPGDPSAIGPTGEVFYQTFDRAAGARIAPATAITAFAAATAVRVLAHGTDYIVLWQDTNSLKCSVNNGATATLRSDSVAKSAFDACIIGSNFVVCYEQNNANVNAVALYAYSIATTPVQQATATVGSEVGLNTGAKSFDSISISGAAGESLYVAYGGRSSLGVFRAMLAIFDANTLSQTVARTSVDIIASNNYPAVGVTRLTSSSCAYVFNRSNGTNYRDVFTNIITSGGALTGAQRDMIGFNMITKPFTLNGIAYVFVADTAEQSQVLPSSYLAAIETSGLGAAIWPLRHVGKIDVLTAATWAPGTLPSVTFPSSTEAIACLPYRGNVDAFVGPLRVGARLVSVTCGASVPTDQWRSAMLDSELYCAASVLTAYDGRQPFDYGFHRPCIIDTSNTSTATTGGLMSAGTYVYSLVPAYRSAAGMLHRGPAMPGFTQVVGGTTTSKVTLQFVGPDLSNKKLSSSINPFTVSVDPFNSEILLHRTTSGGATSYQETWEPRLNMIRPTYQGAEISFVDTRNDTDVGNAKALATRPPLYTVGGELDDHQPPSAITLIRYRGRLVTIAGDQRTLWISKDYTTNVGVAPGFHPSLIVPFAEDLVGLAVLDDKLIEFSKTGAWLIVGSGPAPNGKGAEPDFVSPTRIQSDVGCTNARGIVTFPEGVLFPSVRGLHVLTRGLTVSWMGKRAQDTLAAFPNITSGVLVAAKNQVRWTCNNANGTAGVVLVFDYLRNQWLVFRYYDSDAAVASTPIADAAVLSDGTYVFVTPGGKVYKEAPATSATRYLDDGATWVAASGELAAIRSSGAIGFQRIRRSYLLGDRPTDCDLTISFDVDDKGTFPQSHTWKSDDLALINAGVNVGMRVGCQNGMSPRCRAFGVRWSDAAPTGAGAVVGTGQGCNVSAWALEIVPKTGLERRGARARA